MKILFAKGNSQYGALRDYADMLIAKFKESGHEVIVVDRMKEGHWEKVVDIVDNTFDIVISLQVLAYKVKVLLEEKGKINSRIKYVSICGDHPMYIDYWLKKMENCKNTYLIVSDENQASYLRKYYPYIHTNVIHELIGNAVTPKSYREREYDVYFGGTYFDIVEEQKIIEDYAGEDRKNAKKMIQYVLEHEGAPLEKALEYVLQEQGKFYDLKMFSTYLAKFEAVDRYLRGYYRNYFVNAALMSKAEVVVCGNGWEKSPFIKTGNFRYLGSCETMDRAYDNMVNSKIIVNIMPWSYLGFHDRIVNTMLCQAVCLTNRNKVLDSVFEDGQDLIAVGLQDKEKIIESIQQLLSNPVYAEQIAKNGRNKGKEYFSFDKYYKKLEELLKNIMEEEI